MVFEKKPTLKFRSNEEICKITPLNMDDHQKRRHIHDLFAVHNNSIKIQLNRIIISKFQLKPFNTAVTLNYAQGH